MQFAVKLLLVMLELSMTSCATLETSVAQTKEQFETERSGTPVSVSPKQDKAILSKDYATAEKVLNKAVLEKVRETIRLGLKSPILTIKQKIVQAAAELDDKTLILDLIEALSENQLLLEGGTETKIMQGDLNEAIIFALEKLTEIKFSVSEKVTSEDVSEILKKSREWLKNNQPNVKSN